MKKREHSHKKKILIVDDDLINQKLLERMLPIDQFNVLFASDGEKGMDMVYKELPDVIPCWNADMFRAPVEGST